MLKISHLSSGGVITNYHCSAKCRHCLYKCSQSRPRDYITEERMEKNLDVIQRLGCSSIHIGGGEPVLNRKGIENAVKTAQRCGVYIEYIETNASWYKNEEDAFEFFDFLKAHGVTTLLVSISPFHNEFIPFRKTESLIRSAERRGISIFPWVSSFAGELAYFDVDKVHSIDEYCEKFGENYMLGLPSRYHLTMKGRTLETFAPFMKKHSLTEILAGTGDCRSELSSVSHFHIDLYGNYIPGLCTGLAIDTDDLGQDLDEAKYPFLCSLFEGGVKALFAKASSEYGFIANSEYVSKCELCIAIRHHLVSAGVKSHDLAPEGYYS